MTLPFEPTRSYVYRATRYELLPKIGEMAKAFGDEPFLLRDLSKKLLAETYTQEQLDIKVKKQNSDGADKLSGIFGYYIPFLAQNLKILENLGGGMFKNISLEAEIAEADEQAADVENEPGIIYAYTFPLIMKSGGQRFPIKVGLTTTGDAEARVMQQCKSSAFEFPEILKTWEVQRVGAMEDAIHSTLEARGHKREAPGTEWFDTTVAEIEAIIRFVQPNAK
jgi:hypothetical protein